MKKRKSIKEQIYHKIGLHWLKRLEEKVAERGARLEMEFTDIRHQMHYWHGGWMASIYYKGHEFSIRAVGDMFVTLYDESDDIIAYVKDKGNAGRFYDEMNVHIRSDRHLKKLMSQGRLEFDNNNWWECFLYLPDNTFVDLMWALDAYTISEAIEEVLEGMEEILANYGKPEGIANNQENTQEEYPLHFRNFVKFEVDGEKSLGEYEIIVNNDDEYRILSNARNKSLSAEEKLYQLRTTCGFSVKAEQIVP